MSPDRVAFRVSQFRVVRAVLGFRLDGLGLGAFRVSS